MSWDLIRVVAILFVMAGHLTGLASTLPGIEPYPVQVVLPFGTITLLVLSGYFVGPTLRRGAAGRWFRARLARLLPAYLVAVLAVYTITRAVVVPFNGWQHRDGVLGFLFGDPVRPAEPVADAPPAWHVPDLEDLLTHALLLHEWMPGTFLDGSYWTLPLQVTAFAAAAVLWRWKLHRIVGATVVLWGVMVASAGSVVLALILPHLPTASGLYRAYLFAAGAAIWLWQQRRLSTTHLVFLLGTAVVIQSFRPGTPAVAVLVCFTVMLVGLCLAARGRDWDFPVLRWLRRPVGWLAGISYCLYLVHQQLGYLLTRALVEAGVTPWWLRLAVVVAAAVVAAWLLTVLVERPAYRALTRPRAAGGGREDTARAVPVGGAT